jgi:hypothetical protein
LRSSCGPPERDVELAVEEDLLQAQEVLLAVERYPAAERSVGFSRPTRS